MPRCKRHGITVKGRAVARAGTEPFLQRHPDRESDRMADGLLLRPCLPPPETARLPGTVPEVNSRVQEAF